MRYDMICYDTIRYDMLSEVAGALRDESVRDRVSQRLRAGGMQDALSDAILYYTTL